MENIRRYKGKYILLIVIFLLLIIFPYESIVIPEWRVEIINDNGDPFSNIRVHQSWGTVGDTLTHNWKSETIITDKGGVAIFSAKKMRASILRRIIGGNIYTSALFPPISYTFQASVSVTCRENKDSFIVRYESYEDQTELPQKIKIPLETCTPNL